ncbi:MAG: hypothetical protein AAF613_01605 [Pseudomonadota bacterium]
MSYLQKSIIPLAGAAVAAPAALAHAGHSADQGLGHLLTSLHHYGATWIALGLVAAGGGVVAVRALRARAKR